MAHEQLTAGPISPATDIWALGLIAFFLLTGRSYWKAGTADAELYALLAEVMQSELDPASVRAPVVGASVLLPAAFDAWLARCLDRDPARRFARASEAVEALASALGAPGPRVSKLGEPSDGLPRASERASERPSDQAGDRGRRSAAEVSPSSLGLSLPAVRPRREAPSRLALGIGAASLAIVAAAWLARSSRGAPGDDGPPVAMAAASGASLAASASPGPVVPSGSAPVAAAAAPTASAAEAAPPTAVATATAKVRHIVPPARGAEPATPTATAASAVVPAVSGAIPATIPAPPPPVTTPPPAPRKSPYDVR
jgi:serine/threonine-protein kinase